MSEAIGSYAFESLKTPDKVERVCVYLNPILHVSVINKLQYFLFLDCELIRLGCLWK